MSLEQRGVFYFDRDDEYSEEVLRVFRFENWKDQSDEFLRSLTPELQKKLRQLSLISMAMDVKALDYDHLATTLDLDPKDVELFLVEALLDKAVDGKVDGADKKLYIYSCATRNCTEEQTELANKMLDTFMGRLENLIKSNMAKLKEENTREEKSLKRSIESL